MTAIFRMLGALACLSIAPLLLGAESAAKAADECADPARSCGGLVTPQCLAAYGAGSSALDQPNCREQLGQYRDCVGRVARGCPVEEGEGPSPDRPSVTVATDGCRVLKSGASLALKSGDVVKLCNARDETEFVEVAAGGGGSISYKNGGSGYVTCYVGEICTFFWSGAPRFRVGADDSGAVVITPF